MPSRWSFPRIPGVAAGAMSKTTLWSLGSKELEKVLATKSGHKGWDVSVPLRGRFLGPSKFSYQQLVPSLVVILGHSP